MSRAYFIKMSDAHCMLNIENCFKILPPSAYLISLWDNIPIRFYSSQLFFNVKRKKEKKHPFLCVYFDIYSNIVKKNRKF